MSEETSSNPTLYFLVGGLLVAVLAIGYFTIGRNFGNDTGGTASVAAEAPPVAAKATDEAGSSFKIDVKKDGSVSGSINEGPKE